MSVNDFSHHCGQTLGEALWERGIYFCLRFEGGTDTHRGAGEGRWGVVVQEQLVTLHPVRKLKRDEEERATMLGLGHLHLCIQSA